MLLTGDFLSLLGIFNTKLSECRILSWDTQLISLVLILSNVPQREEPTGTGPLRPLNARLARGGLARLPRPARSPCCSVVPSLTLTGVLRKLALGRVQRARERPSKWQHVQSR